MLTINIADLKHNVGAEAQHEIFLTPDELCNLETDAKFDLATPLKVWVKLTNIGNGILARGEISGREIMNCARCLKEFFCPISIPFEEQLTPQDDTVDLTEALTEALLLEAPLKPLCRPDCRGLCPRCGRDLNEGECGCDTRVVNPKFEVLRKLMLE